MPRLYVAGKFAQAQTIKGIAEKFEQQGYTITHRWWDAEGDGNDDPETWAPYADMDIEGVTTADAVVAYMDDPDYAYRGTWCEIGMAMGAGVPVVIIEQNVPLGCYVRKNVFYHASRIAKVPSVAAAEQWLRTYQPVHNDSVSANPVS